MKTFKTFPETDCPRANALVVEPFCLGDFFIMETEIWKDIPDYEGLYQASSLGKIKSLGRKRVMPTGGIRTYPEKILKYGKDKKGYCMVNLCKNGVNKAITVHRLVYETFNGKTNLHIDHIVEGNPSDNRLCNLQAITCRKNISKHHLSTNKSSSYTGVSWHKGHKKWYANIFINKKPIYLGHFSTELEAAKAYQDKLNTIK